jgi:hypothetical protein
MILLRKAYHSDWESGTSNLYLDQGAMMGVQQKLQFLVPYTVVDLQWANL